MLQKRIEKLDTVRGGTRRLHKEAVLLRNSASEIYWHEIAKEESLRDVSLLEECLATIEYATGIIEHRSATREAKHHSFSSLRGLQRLGVCLCALVVATALTFGVSYALGVNLFSVIFGIGENSVEIRGNTGDANETNAPQMPTDGFVDFSDISDACAQLSINPLIFDLTKGTFVVDNIYGASDSHMTTLCIDYVGDNESYFYYTVYLYSDTNTAYSVTAGSSDTAGSICTINDKTFYLAGDANGTTALWQDGAYVYQINTSIDNDTMTALIDEQYKQIKQGG